MIKWFKYILMFVILFSFNELSATHNRAGEITYVHVFGNTYEFTITTCTKTSSEADRDELEIFWGDGTSDIIPRSNIDFIPGENAQKNSYVGQHTYTGAGTYVVQVEDPNRNEGVLNITQSVLVPFCIQTTIKISPFLGPDNSIQIEGCPCPEYACFNKKWCYNVKAFDPDGDSLSYQLVPCRGENCDELLIPAQYTYPNDVGGGTLNIDEQTGTICWDSPQVIGEYNFAVLITSWRAGQFISSVLHDLQITVTNCLNDPPVLDIPADTCVVAGDSINIPITASDINGDEVTLTATGTSFNVGSSPSSFTSNSPNQNVAGAFSWSTDCTHPQNSDYQVVFEATDGGAGVSLSDIRVLRIRVVAPPVENVVVDPQGGSMNISWNASDCNVSEYKIYRSTSPLNNIDDCCIGFDAEAEGFELVGTIDGNTLTYLDNDNLVIGNEYCYFVTSVLENGIESCPSDTDCDQLRLEVPIITHVSVVNTDAVNGTDTIIWAPPKELQTSVFSGPYEYRLYRGLGFTGNTETLIHTTAQEVVLDDTDTIYHDISGLDNLNNPYYYRVELYSAGDLVGSSNKASSVFLSTTPNDNEILLSWSFNVPWTNNQYEVYRETPTGSGTFTLIATTTDTTYTDTGLINRELYCYRVKAIGEYTAPGIVSPLINWSQIACDEPFDFTPPCPPGSVSIESDCENGINSLSWSNPNFNCDQNDAVSYTIYYTPVENGEYEVIATLDDINDTTITFNNLSSVAGCYYITATDSVFYSNESDSSTIVCVDNCPEYQLPNVFTPDGDGANDLFHPILPYRHVESIDLTIFNRWGKPVFSTTDPDINWDGTYQENGEMVTEGVYFYLCKINTIRLSGIETLEIQGNIHLIR